MASELTWCCGREVSRIELTAHPVEIVLETCPACDGRNWLLDGREVDREAALAAIGSVARANRYSLPPRLPAGWTVFPWVDPAPVPATA